MLLLKIILALDLSGTLVLILLIASGMWLHIVEPDLTSKAITGKGEKNAEV